jgi:ribose-phosphate pyrophosphokinase
MEMATAPIKSEAVAALNTRAPAIARWLRDQVGTPLLVGPDEESRLWVAEVARLAQAPFTVMDKTRRGDRDVSVVMQSPGEDWAGCTPVLVDDIVSTGHTLIAAAQALREAGLAPPVCVAVHALCEPDAEARLRAGGIARLVSCDSIAHPTNAIALGPELAPALRDLTAALAAARVP